MHSLNFLEQLPDVVNHACKAGIDTVSCLVAPWHIADGESDDYASWVEPPLAATMGSWQGHNPVNVSIIYSLLGRVYMEFD